MEERVWFVYRKFNPPFSPCAKVSPGQEAINLRGVLCKIPPDAGLSVSGSPHSGPPRST